jgi:CPA2 family monovalent cation:H+ antiporter-2
LASTVSPSEYKDVVLFLATAGVVVPLFRRMKLSPILGFLGVGVLLGPFGLGALSGSMPWLSSFTIRDPKEIAQLAELGVVFLLFMIGLELSWERLRLMRRLVFGLGALQVTLGIVAVAAIGVALGLPVGSALVIGAALCLSSTAMVMPILAERKRQHTPAGRAIFSVLLFQDLAVAPILITIAVVGAQTGETLSIPKLLLAFAPAAFGLVVLVVLGRLLLRPMMKSVAKAKSEELFMAACLLVVIGAGVISSMAGLSMALGAFIAGLLLAETEFRHEIEVTIEPFKGLLLGLFFVSIGIGLDLSIVIAKPLTILSMTLGMIALNGSVVFILAKLFKLKLRQATETALLLAASGEFAFVILDGAMHQGIVATAIGQTVLVASTVSMFMIPILAAIGARVGSAGKSAEAPSEEPPITTDKPAVLVVGYGRVGKLIGGMLDRHDIAWVAADREARNIEAARREGKTVYFGDASRPEFLKRCGLDTAPALVVTMDSPEGNEAVVATARQLRPDLIVVARARDARHAQRLYELGATDAVPETIEASLQLSEALLVDMGVPMGLVIASIHERRDEFRKFLNRPDAMGGRTRRARDALNRA